MKQVYLLVFLCLSLGASAQRVFISPAAPLNTGSAIIQQKVIDKKYGRYQVVHVNREALLDESLRLEFMGEHFVAERTRQADNHNGTQSWFGDLQEGRGKLTITSTPHTLYARLVFGNRIFEVEAAGTAYIVSEMNQASLPAEACFNSAPPEIVPVSGSRGTAVTEALPDCKIRVLVMFTPAVAVGFADLNMAAQSYIDATNEAFTNSSAGSAVELAYVGTTTVNNNSPLSDAVITQLKNPTDGYFDEMFALRRQYAADFCVLIAGITDNCGQAGGISADYASAFVTVSPNCALTLFTFPHELAHLYGCRHDLANDPNTTIAYAHGYRNTSENWRTIMAYQPNIRINYFSNPAVMYTGVNAAGTTMGTAAFENNARVITERHANMQKLYGPACGITRVYVKTGGTGSGSSWNDAMGNLSDAINGTKYVNRATGTRVTEIWVAKGTYKPELDSAGNPSPAEARSKTFYLPPNVRLYGGFAGTEGNITERIIASNPTILSGDLGNASANDNAWHVVMAENITGAELNGFTIQSGNTSGDAQLTMGACLVVRGRTANASVAVNNCTFQTALSATCAGIYADAAAGLTTGLQIGTSTFNGLSGALYTTAASGTCNLTISRSRFASCTNTALTALTGVSGTAGTDISNTVFYNNSGALGGAINAQATGGSATLKITNSTFSGNAASTNGDAIYLNDNISLSCNNNIIWNNANFPARTPVYAGNGSVSTTINNTDIQGTYSGAGNMSADPLFTASGSGDLHIKTCSPVVNQGSNVNAASLTVDADGVARIFNNTVDMGAYEIQSIAGSTMAGTTGGTQVSSAITVGSNPAYPVYDANCNLILNIQPQGVFPISGSTVCKVKIDNAVNVTLALRPYVQRHYDIEPASAGNAPFYTARLTLYFTQTDFNNFNAFPFNGPDLPKNPTDAAGIANLRIFQYHGTSTSYTPNSYTGSSVEIDPADQDVIWNASLSRWEVSFDVNGFSGFFAGNAGNTILPVQLISFEGFKNGNFNLVNWTAAAEKDMLHYELERSTDGQQFTVCHVQPAFNQINKNTYTFTDSLHGINSKQQFYRLKMVDKDGGFTRSNTVQISRNGTTKNLFTLYPNPVKDVLYIAAPAQTGVAVVSIYNAAGQQLIRQTVTAAAQAGINTSTLPAGIYVAEYRTYSGVQRQSFVKR